MPAQDARGRVARDVRAQALAAAVAAWGVFGLLSACAPALAREDVEAETGGAGAGSAPTFHYSLDSATDAARREGLGRPGAAPGLVLAVFGAEWCGACRALRERALEADEFRRRAGPLHVVEVDVDAAGGAARRFRVRAVPDCVLLADDGRLLARRRGVLSAEELVRWVERGRKVAASGLWEGAAASAEQQEEEEEAPFHKKDKKDEKERTPRGDTSRLVDALGDPDPGRRLVARDALSARGLDAVPGLVRAAGHEYLGVRIGAAELLGRMAPGAPVADPWAPADRRAPAVQALSKWWDDARKLPHPLGSSETARGAEPAPATTRAAAGAVRAVLSDDQLTRTGGMSTLLGIGRPALPEVRKAIARLSGRSARPGDDGALSALLCVRWAILVTPHLEERFPGTRFSLGRGSAPERRGAAKRLRAAGRRALPVLVELVTDPDNIVREGALAALSGVGGAGSLVAMATLLEAQDPNLRMVAAQSLGRTKDARAAKHLVTLLGDPDEVVAATAIAALEEIKATSEADALARCLKDERWRVRAAAAEALGKLKAKGKAGELGELLEDPDGFVVKSALVALKEMRSKLGYEKLKPVVARSPATAPTVFDIIFERGSPQDVELASRVYDDFAGEAGVEVRMALLEKLAKLSSGSGGDDEHWAAFIEKAASNGEARIRELVARVLAKRSPLLSSRFVGALLADAEPRVRGAAAEVALRVAATDWGVTKGAGGRRRSGGPSRTADTDADRQMRERHSDWHDKLADHAATLKEQPGGAVDLTTVFAIFATGDGVSDLPLLEEALEREDVRKAVSEAEGDVVEEVGIATALKRLPWPEGRPLVEKACRRPLLYRHLIANAKHASEEAGEFLLDPERVAEGLARTCAAAETAGDAPQREDGRSRELERTLRELLAGSAGAKVVLTSESDRNRRTTDRLLQSDRPVLRAAAVYARGFWQDRESVGIVKKAMSDESPWVRLAAAQVVARKTLTREKLMERLGPLLSDGSVDVAAMAATGLLTPEVRGSASLERALDNFHCGELEIWGSRGSFGSKRPPRRLPTPSAEHLRFLDRAREVQETLDEGAGASATDEQARDAVELLTPFALLLAQYGDTSGVDLLVRRWSSASGESGRARLPDAIIAGIALSRDAKYLDVVRKAMAKADEEYEVRELLKALRGTKGAEARQLRREINRRLRELRRR